MFRETDPKRVVSRWIFSGRSQTNRVQTFQKYGKRGNWRTQDMKKGTLTVAERRKRRGERRGVGPAKMGSRPSCASKKAGVKWYFIEDESR